MNYFERIFQEIRSQIQEQILYRTYALQKNYFWTKLALAGCGTFFFSIFCIWFLILQTRIQSFEKSREVVTESFLNEVAETIVHKCS